MHTIINGLKTHYNIKGKGNFMFLLHGWGANIELFNNLSEVISAKYTVVAVDLPGFGKSDEPGTPWSVTDYTNFVIEFIKTFNCTDIAILGHSFGGRIIIKMANHPNLPFSINKIILVDSAGILPRRDLKYKVRLRTYKIAKAILSLGVSKLVFPNALDSFRKKMGSSDYSSASIIMRQCLVKTVNEDLTPLLNTIKIPTLLVWGENDTATPLADGRLMEKLIPDAGLVVLKNAGHYAFLDQPFIFNKVIKSFLQIGE